MSHQATTWVMEFSESRLADRLVLLAIAHRVSNDTGAAFPSIATICREANLSERQVQYSIKSLEGLGEIQVKRSGSELGTHLYRMPKFIAWMQSLHPAKSAPGAKRAPAKSVTGGAKQHEQNAPEPKDNHHLEPSEKNKGAASAPSSVPIPDWLPKKDWNDYLEMRRRIRKPLTQRGTELAIAKLDRLRSSGQNPGAVLQQSVFNSWQGLFAVHQEGTNGSRKGDRGKAGGAYRSDRPPGYYDRKPDFVVS